MDLKDPVSTNLHCVRRWLSGAINLMLIIPQDNTSLALVKTMTKTDARKAYWQILGLYYESPLAQW